MSPRSFFLALVAVDSIFAAIYVYFGLGVMFGFEEAIPLKFHIGKDWTYPETWSYVKWALAAIVAALIFASTRKKPYLALLLIFVLLLLDDSLRGHEQAGVIISKLAVQSGISSIDIGHGEVIAFGLIGVAIVVLLLIGGRREAREIQRQLMIVAAILLVGAFFAVFLDFIRGYFVTDSPFEKFLTVLEDYGETVATSGVLAYVYHLFVQQRAQTDVSTSPADRVAPTE